MIDSDVDVGSLTVRGSLRWGNVPGVRLAAGFVVAEESGTIIIGSADSPAPDGSTIYIKDNGREHTHLKARSFGNHGHMSMLHVEGRPLRRTWALLVETARAGTSSFTVDGNLEQDGWRVGDAIAIAPLGHRQMDAERFTLTSIAPGQGYTVLGISGSLRESRLGRPDKRLQVRVCVCVCG